MGEQQVDISAEMVSAAIKKAVEAGIMPRRCYKEDAVAQADIMYRILQAALSTRATPEHKPGHS